MRKLLFLLALAVPVVCFGQGSTTTQPIVISNSLGRPLGGVSVEICNTPSQTNPSCSSPASIFSNSGLSTPITCSGPTTCLTTDSLGQVPTFFASPGFYCYVATAAYVTDTSCKLIVLYAATGGTAVVTNPSGNQSIIGNFNLALASETLNGNSAAQSINIYDISDANRLTVSKLLSSNAGSHTTTQQYVLGIESRPLGSGLNGPNAADFGLGVSQVKQNWLTSGASAATGEVDGLNVVTRQGGTASDTAGILIDSAHAGTGFMAQIEGHTSSISSPGGAITRQLGTQIGVIDNINSLFLGYETDCSVGTCGNAIHVQTEVGANWTNYFRGGNSSAVNFLIDGNGKITQGMATAPRYFLDIDAGAAGTGVHLANDTADQGTYLVALNADASGSLTQNATFNGTNWVAKLANSSQVSLSGAHVQLYGNTGLTPGNTFTPTQMADFDPTVGLTLNGPSGGTAKISGDSITLLNQQAPAGAITGTGADATVYTFSIPANTIKAGKGIRVNVAWAHSTATAAVTYKLKLGSTTLTTIGPTNDGTGGSKIIAEIFNNPGVQNAQWMSAYSFLTTSGSNFLAGTAAENTANALTLTFTFSVAATDQVTPKGWSVELIQ